MTILNRGQIVVFQSENFQSWAKQNSEEDLFFSSQGEPTVYLIEEEFWEDELILEKYRKKSSEENVQKFVPMKRNGQSLRTMINFVFTSRFFLG